MEIKKQLIRLLHNRIRGLVGTDLEDFKTRSGVPTMSASKLAASHSPSRGIIHMYRMPPTSSFRTGPHQGPEGRRFACKDNPKGTYILNTTK